MKFLILNQWLDTPGFTEFDLENIALAFQWRIKLYGFSFLGRGTKIPTNDFLKSYDTTRAANVINEGAKCIHLRFAPFLFKHRY